MRDTRRAHLPGGSIKLERGQLDVHAPIDALEVRWEGQGCFWLGAVVAGWAVAWTCTHPLTRRRCAGELDTLAGIRRRAGWLWLGWAAAGEMCTPRRAGIDALEVCGDVVRRVG